MIALSRSLRFRAVSLAFVTSVAACGGGGGGDGIVGPPGPPAAVASVSTSPSAATVIFGNTTQLSATTKDASGNALSGRAVTWASSDGTVATVDAAGLVTATGAGTATITATSEGKSGSAVITVTKPAVAQVVVTPASASIRVGESVTLTVTLKDAQGNVLTQRTIGLSRDLTYVTSNGLVITGKAAGNTSVLVTSEGITTTVPITVTP